MKLLVKQGLLYSGIPEDKNLTKSGGSRHGPFLPHADKHTFDLPGASDLRR